MCKSYFAYLSKSLVLINFRLAHILGQGHIRGTTMPSLFITALQTMPSLFIMALQMMPSLFIAALAIVLSFPLSGVEGGHSAEGRVVRQFDYVCGNALGLRVCHPIYDNRFIHCLTSLPVEYTCKGRFKFSSLRQKCTFPQVNSIFGGDVKREHVEFVHKHQVIFEILLL